MTARGNLFIVSGKDYDERLRMYDEFGRVLFDGYAYTLVTRVRGQLELMLNFGSEGSQTAFALRRAGGDALLMPTIDISAGPVAISPQRLPVIVEWSVVEHLWSHLRYNPTEVLDIANASTSDWLTAWLAGCPDVGHTEGNLSAGLKAPQRFSRRSIEGKKPSFARARKNQPARG